MTYGRFAAKYSTLVSTASGIDAVVELFFSLKYLSRYLRQALGSKGFFFAARGGMLGISLGSLCEKYETRIVVVWGCSRSWCFFGAIQAYRLQVRIENRREEQ